MRAYTLAHLSDTTLLRSLTSLVAHERNTTASLLAHLAEVDARRLFVPAGYATMFEYCVRELRLSEDVTYKRIQAARAARQFPELFAALADGRLHLAAVCLLAPHLTRANFDELMAAATHRRKSEIEQLLACQFPRPEMAAIVRAMPSRGLQLAPGQAGEQKSSQASAIADLLSPGQVEVSISGKGVAGVDSPAPGQVENSPRLEMPPIETERFLVRLIVGKGTHDKLRHAQALLSHVNPSGDVAQVFERALDALIAQLEKRKFAATPKPHSGLGEARGPSSIARPRHVPAHVRRAVWERDQGQCTFVSEVGHRCSARRFLEFDHIDPVARGGRATVDAMRLRCRAHNQLEAERVFGTGFMSEKRTDARRTAPARAPAPHAAAPVEAREGAPVSSP